MLNFPIKVLCSPCSFSCLDSEPGEDDASSTQVTQRSHLQDETTYSSPTGEQKPGRELQSIMSRTKSISQPPEDICADVPGCLPL